MNYPITFSFIFLKLESRKHLFIHSNEDTAEINDKFLRS